MAGFMPEQEEEHHEDYYDEEEGSEEEHNDDYDYGDEINDYGPEGESSH